MASRRRRKSYNDLYVVIAALVVLYVLAFRAAFLFYLVISVGIGVAIWYVARTLQQQEGFRKLELAQIDTLPGIEFERWAGEQLRLQGYRVKYTPVNDFGVDIIATKDGVKLAVQTKRYARPLDQKAVREVFAGMYHYGCNECMVMTNSSFTTAATVLAQSTRCRLVDRDELARWVNNDMSYLDEEESESL